MLYPVLKETSKTYARRNFKISFKYQFFSHSFFEQRQNDARSDKTPIFTIDVCLNIPHTKTLTLIVNNEIKIQPKLQIKIENIVKNCSGFRFESIIGIDITIFLEQKKKLEYVNMIFFINKDPLLTPKSIMILVVLFGVFSLNYIQ